ncbi:hypothetical protein Hanom_Chr05g00440661 [Helianthus anomalus]
MTNTYLVFHSIITLIIILGTLCANLLVILLQSRKILTSFRELTFLHTLTHIPVHESTLSIHKVKLVVNAREHLSHTSRVGDHTNSPLHLSQVSSRHHSRWLVVNTALETSRTPVNKLDGPLGLDGCNRSIHILGDNITTVHQTASHVLAVTRVTLCHHRGRLKSTVGDFSNR